MKHINRLFLASLCFTASGLFSQTLTASAVSNPVAPQLLQRDAFQLAQLDPLEDKVVKVTFKPGTPASLIEKISHAFGAPMTKLENQTYVFQVPALKTQDQYAELFAALPTVLETVPVPEYKVADHIQPQAVHFQGVDPQTPVQNEAAANTTTGPDSNGQAANYVPGEVLVKFKTGVTAADIAFFNQQMGTVQVSRIAGIDVYRLRLPQGMSVNDAIARYQASEWVDYAEPNYTMSLPRPVNGTQTVTAIPLDGGGQMLVHFRPGSSREVIDKFQAIYGTRWVKKTSFYSYRVQLPAGLNPAVAARVFKLYPGVSDVQRLYS